MKRTVLLLLSAIMVASSQVAFAGGPAPSPTWVAGCDASAGGFQVVNGHAYGGGFAKYRLDQTFTPSRSGPILSAKLKGFARHASTIDPDVIVRIMTVDSSGVPTDTELGSTTIPGNQITDDGSVRDLVAHFEPATSPFLDANQKYSLAVTLSETDDAQNSWRIKSGDVCPGGELFFEKDLMMHEASGTSYDAGYDVFLGPANDDFAYRQKIRGDVASVFGTTAGATREAGEPDHYPGEEGDRPIWEGDHTVWYEWTSPGTGPVTFNTCDSFIDSILAVYTDEDLSDLSEALIGDNNNNEEMCPTDTWEWGSYLTFDAVVGTTYKIAVGDAGGARENTFTLAISGPNDRPVVTPIKPVPGSKIRNRSPLVKARVGDSFHNLRKKNIKLFLDGKQKSGFEYDRATDLLKWKAPKLGKGRHRVRIVATDPFGATGKKKWAFKVTP